MEHVRRPAVAGSFYPREANELTRLLEECFVTHPLGPRGAESPTPSLLGGMVPHAGYVYSGACAAHFYSSLDKDIDSVVLMGVNHRGEGAKVALSPADYWETPLGRVRVDRGLGEILKDQIPFLVEDERAHRQEHSIEVQIPFLQRVLGKFSFLPVSISHLSEQECIYLGQVIAHMCESEATKGKRTVLIASSDLSHYLPPKETERLDRLAVEQVLSLEPLGLLNTVQRADISMCGVFPTTALLVAARTLGAKGAQLLKHCHSGHVAPMNRVVGYASVAVVQDLD